MKFKFNIVRFLGVLLFWIGIVFVLNSFTGMSGYAIVDDIGKGEGSILALVFIIGGLVLFLKGLEEEAKMVKVRHYTTPSRARRIASSRRFGGEQAPRQLGQAKVYVEPARSRVLSPADFRRRYAITGKQTGRAYVEFEVPEDELESEKNPRTGKTEYFLRCKGVEEGVCVYPIESDVDIKTRN